MQVLGWVRWGCLVCEAASTDGAMQAHASKHGKTDMGQLAVCLPLCAALVFHSIGFFDVGVAVFTGQYMSTGWAACMGCECRL